MDNTTFIIHQNFHYFSSGYIGLIFFGLTITISITFLLGFCVGKFFQMNKIRKLQRKPLPTLPTDVKELSDQDEPFYDTLEV